MSQIDSSIYTGKSVEKDLVLAFEEGDDVISGLKQAIQQHGIREATAINADGLLKEATIQYFNHSRFTTTELKKGRIVSCSGRFMNLKDGVYGDLHVGFMLGMQMWDGTLVKAVAKNGFQLTLRFHQPVSDPIKEQGLGGVQF
jgi:predicted DNA-binding protein with PD1-like motif